MHQTGIKVGVKQGELLSLTLAYRNFREPEQNLNLDLRTQHDAGRRPFQKFGLFGQITSIPPADVQNFTKNVKDKLYENWEELLEVLRKI